MPTQRKPRIVVKNSRIHGRGVYAARRLKAGENIIEYKGERIPWKEADSRPPSDPDEPYHTFFFSLDDQKTVIDAGVGGNAARWINHSCDPNCETEETDDGRVFIQAMRDIRPGEELNYDYCADDRRASDAHSEEELRVPMRLEELPRHDARAEQAANAENCKPRSRKTVNRG